MKLNKFFKLAIGAIFAFPTSLFLGNEILANHLSERVEYDLYQGDLLAGCGGGGGGGGGGSSPAAKKAKKVKKAKAKVMFKKRKLSEAAAAGESTAALEAEIKALEAEIAENE